jgi:transcriptional regulator with XRE-family HTH domain
MHARSSGAKKQLVADSAYVIGRNLGRICRTRGISVSDLAALLGRTNKSVEQMLKGQCNLDLREIASIARHLRIKIAELLRGL